MSDIPEPDYPEAGAIEDKPKGEFVQNIPTLFRLRCCAERPRKSTGR